MSVFSWQSGDEQNIIVTFPTADVVGAPGTEARLPTQQRRKRYT
jgi:hypothetical protein